MCLEDVSAEAWEAIDYARNYLTYTHFLSANDCGKTGSHQAGILISKTAWLIMFSEQPDRGDGTLDNLKREAIIKWPDRETKSVFTYYRHGTRDEYRLTRFGRGFGRIDEDRVGDLFVLCLENADGETWRYRAWTLRNESDINGFLGFFGMSPGDTNQLISHTVREPTPNEILYNWVESLTEFPTTSEMSEKARWLCSHQYDADLPRTDPDLALTQWMQSEYSIFRLVESALYNDKIRAGFPDIDTFLNCAQTLLQRRKSRAGKSFELHLQGLFTAAGLRFSSQEVTELHKRPDFVFPSIEAYRNANQGSSNVIVLAAKTTCKDRWRQVMSEADKVDTHYLVTLQQGISATQLDEMEAARVQLVVPKRNLSKFPSGHRDRIWTISRFIDHASRVVGM